MSDDSAKGGDVSDSQGEVVTDPEHSDTQMLPGSPPQSGDEKVKVGLMIHKSLLWSLTLLQISFT